MRYPQSTECIRDVATQSRKGLCIKLLERWCTMVSNCVVERRRHVKTLIMWYVYACIQRQVSCQAVGSLIQETENIAFQNCFFAVIRLQLDRNVRWTVLGFKQRICNYKNGCFIVVVFLINDWFCFFTIFRCFSQVVRKQSVTSGWHQLVRNDFAANRDSVLSNF